MKEPVRAFDPWRRPGLVAAVRACDAEPEPVEEPECIGAPALTLWTDASLNNKTGNGGIAVVRLDGRVELSMPVAGPLRGNQALERQAVREAVVIASRMIRVEEVWPVEIRTDCKSAAARVYVAQELRDRLCVRWRHRAGNTAHREARRAAGLS